VAGVLCALVALLLLAYRFYFEHRLSWDLLAVVLTNVLVKLALMTGTPSRTERHADEEQEPQARLPSGLVCFLASRSSVTSGRAPASPRNIGSTASTASCLGAAIGLLLLSLRLKRGGGSVT
jgi:hypothetical protein